MGYPSEDYRRYSVDIETSNGDGLLDLSPLSDEVSQRLGLNSRTASEFYGVSAELDCPLDDTAIGLFVTKNIPQRELGDQAIL